MGSKPADTSGAKWLIRATLPPEAALEVEGCSLMLSKEGPKYISAAETRELLAQGARALAERLRGGDMLSLADAAEASGAAPATVMSWIERGRAIALDLPEEGLRLPRWQFEPIIWDALPQLSKALNSTEPWRLLSFLESPLGGLNGLTPRQFIDQHGLERVLALAAEEA